MRISTALGTIQGAHILPAVADQLRSTARAETVHFSNLIEGNDLPLVEAERATRNELSPDSRAKIELVNYVSALDFIDQQIASKPLELSGDFLKELQGIITKGLGREDDPHFKPRHEGEWRDGVAAVIDRVTGEALHVGPPAGEVPSRMESMFSWLQLKLESGSEPTYVVAGVAHYAVTDIHPFADGNGRAARLLQAAILMKEGLLPNHMFSFEAYYAKDKGAYYEALRSVRRNTLNMETWLEYFLTGLAEEYEKVAATVTDLSAITQAPGQGQLQLKRTQEKALVELRTQGLREFTRREYQELTDVGRTTATSEIRELVDRGLLVKVGGGPEARYRFAGASKAVSQTRGRPAKWTDRGIEAELGNLVKQFGRWPTSAEFEAAGRRDLYAAASRNGGIRRWRNRLMHVEPGSDPDASGQIRR